MLGFFNNDFARLTSIAAITDTLLAFSEFEVERILVPVITADRSYPTTKNGDVMDRWRKWTPNRTNLGFVCSKTELVFLWSDAWVSKCQKNSWSENALIDVLTRPHEFVL